MGGGKIRDATALPEDVRKGKVFYDNQGRQVGNAVENPWSDLKYIVIDLKSGSSNENINVDYYTNVKVIEIDEYDYHKIQNSYDNNLKQTGFPYANKIALKGKIFFAELEGKTFYLNYDFFDQEIITGLRIQEWQNSNHVMYQIYHDGNYLYLWPWSDIYSGQIKLWYK